MSCGFIIAAELIDILSAPSLKSTLKSSVLRIPPPTVNGINTLSATLLTSMDCDGTKAGYDIELTNTIASNVSIPVIASGGAGGKEHFLDAFTKGKADAALAASLFHYKELDIMELKKYLADNGIPMRM